MEQSDLFRHLVEALETRKLAYFITGSMASTTYGEPRFTNDIDAVVRLTSADVDAFCEAFPAPDFYVSKDAVHQSITDHHQFNILHPKSGLKIDVMIPDQGEFNESRWQRRARRPTGMGISAYFASPEDVIVKKLAYFQEGGSEKHLRDIAGILKVQQGNLDLEYVEKWVRELGLLDAWNELKAFLKAK